MSNVTHLAILLYPRPGVTHPREAYLDLPFFVYSQ